jgi:hypothetical protein
LGFFCGAAVWRLYYVAQAGLELMDSVILPLQHPQFWDNRHHHQALFKRVFFFNTLVGINSRLEPAAENTSKFDVVNNRHYEGLSE